MGKIGKAAKTIKLQGACRRWAVKIVVTQPHKSESSCLNLIFHFKHHIKDGLGEVSTILYFKIHKSLKIERSLYPGKSVLKMFIHSQ